jgi:hypothetical protein
MGLEHPDQIVEMARVQGIARRLTLANGSAISQGQAPEFKGIVAGAMEMPQVRLMSWADHRCKQGHQDGSAQRHQMLDLGRRIYPKTRGRGRR